MERYVTRSDPLRRITYYLDILICVLRRWDLNIKYQAFPEFSLERNHHFLRALKRRRSTRKNSKWEVMCSWYPVTRRLFRVSSSFPVLERYRTRLILRHCTGVFNIFYSILLRSTASSRDVCVVPPVDIGEFGSQLGMKSQQLELVPATPMRWQLAQVWCYRAFNATRARSHVTYVHGSKRQLMCLREIRSLLHCGHLASRSSRLHVIPLLNLAHTTSIQRLSYTPTLLLVQLSPGLRD